MGISIAQRAVDMAEAKDKDLARTDAVGDEVLGDPRPKEKEPLAGGKAAGTILVTFVDSEKLTVLSPEDGRIAMEIQKADGTVVEKNAILQKVDPKGKDAPTDSTGKPMENVYALDLGNYPLSTFMPTFNDAGEDLEIPCDIPRISSPTAILGALYKPLTAGCQSYLTTAMMTGVPAAGDKAPCNTVPIPATPVESVHTLRFIAYDRCIGDYIKHPEALLDDVKVEVRTVQGPKSASSRNAPFQSRKFSAVTKDGYAEIAGLPLNQPIEIHFTAPEKYTCAISTASRAFVSSGSSHMMIIPFDPCGDFPVRSVIFVPSGCTGNRVKALSFTVGEETQTLGEACDGVWTIPQDASGTLTFTSVGAAKIFRPSAITLHKDSPLVFMVEIADAGMSVSRRNRFQFTDHEGRPFAHRRVRLKLPSGLEEHVTTGEDGWFEAEEGALASADDDAHGYAVEAFPLLTTEME
jgi:hypothetical protein